MKPIITDKLVAKFWERVRKGPNCWDWTGSINPVSAYGQITIWHEGKNYTYRANRLSYQIHFGNPGELVVCHKCDNRGCVRPDHLFLGTQRDNIQDCRRKGRMNNKAKSIPGAKNGRAKLTQEQVYTIRKRYAQGETQIALGREYGVSQGTVSSIVKHKTWSI